MKMAKASKDDIDQCIKFFQYIEEYMEHGTHTPSEDKDGVQLTEQEFVEGLRDRWGERFKPAKVDTAWLRVVYGCDILIDNVCDPDQDVLEFSPKLQSMIDANLPTELTAENGAKGALIGEFFESIELENDDACDGQPETIIQKVPVSWTTIKNIWKKAVEHFRSQAANVVESEGSDGE